MNLQNDFGALVALIQCCDLVISSPTNILKYIGILGKEAWIVTDLFLAVRKLAAIGG